MPPPRFPSRIDPLSFPVFGISWFAEPAEGGRSIYAYCGGGGSAKTGVKNSVVIFGERNGPRQISTGDQIGVALKIYQNPISRRIWLIVALGRTVKRYPLDFDSKDELVSGGQDESDQEQVVDLGEDCSCVAVAANSMANQIALGCESGMLIIFESSDEQFTRGNPLYTMQNHSKAICAIDYASRTIGRLISSAKDGTACIVNDGELIAGLRCSVTDPSQPPPKRQPQIMVRGCAFGDTDGKLCYTIASARRGKAYLAQWEEEIDESGKLRFVCISRSACSDCPISAMSLSADLSLLVLGSVDGAIILWNVNNWKPLKIFSEVHHLPVTCIAARPFFSLQAYLQGEEEDGIMIHARSASADSQLGCLTAQRNAKKKKVHNGIEEASFWSLSTLLLFVHRLLILIILLMAFTPLFEEAKEKCAHLCNLQGIIAELPMCLLQDVFWGPSWRPGITSPPY